MLLMVAEGEVGAGLQGGGTLLGRSSDGQFLEPDGAVEAGTGDSDPGVFRARSEHRGLRWHRSGDRYRRTVAGTVALFAGAAGGALRGGVPRGTWSVGAGTGGGQAAGLSLKAVRGSVAQSTTGPMSSY